MNNAHQILNQFLIRTGIWIVKNNNLSAVSLTEVFEPVKAKTSEAVFVRDKDFGDFLVFHVLQKPISFRAAIVKATPNIADSLIEDDSFGIAVLGNKIHLIFQIVLLPLRRDTCIGNVLPLIWYSEKSVELFFSIVASVGYVSESMKSSFTIPALQRAY